MLPLPYRPALTIRAVSAAGGGSSAPSTPLAGRRASDLTRAYRMGGNRPAPTVCAAGTPRPPSSESDREGDVGLKDRAEVKRPERWKVVLYNDDYTPMEFVVAVLEQVFGKPPTEATQIMLRIHRGGKGIAGVYILEIAETKVTRVHQLAEERGYPLRAGVEKE